MRFVSVSLTQLLSMMAALGNDVQGILVGDDMVCYIVLPDERSQQTQQVLQQYGAVTMELSNIKYAELAGNTPHNFRHAILAGTLRRPAEPHQHLWKRVCDVAGIVDESWAQTVVQVSQYVAALIIFGRTSNA